MAPVDWQLRQNLGHLLEKKWNQCPLNRLWTVFIVSCSVSRQIGQNSSHENGPQLICNINGNIMNSYYTPDLPTPTKFCQ